MAFIPSSGSVVAFQSDPTKLVGTVSVVGTLPVVLNNASVIATIQGSVGTVIIGGSIAASFTPPANQSVSGTVGASIVGQLPAGTAVLGSVAALQGTNPWIVTSSIAGGIFPISGSVAATITNTNVNVGGSVVAFQGAGWSGSVAAIIIGGSVATATTNSSVMLLNGGNMIGSIAAYQGSIPWTIGSVYGNISGSVAATVTNTVTVVSSIAGGIFPISGSVAATITNTNVNVGGSVVAFQGGAPWANTNAGSIAAVIIGGSIATATTNSSVMLLNGGSMIGSVAAYQGSIPWIMGSIYGNISGSVAATITNTNVNVSGSVVAFQGTGWSGSVAAFQAGTQITSLVSTTPSSVQVGASIMGIAPVTLTANTVTASALSFLGATSSVTSNIASVITVTGYNNAVFQLTSSPSMTGTVTWQGAADNSSWRPLIGYNMETGVLSSVTTVADANWAFNVSGLNQFRALLNPWTAGSVTGKVYLTPADGRSGAVYVTNSTPSSMLAGASIFGQLPAGTAMLGSVVAYQGVIPWTIGSVYGNISGSVAATITNTNVNVSGSVVAFQGAGWSGSVAAVQLGTWKPSIASNYTSNTASIISAVGDLVLGIRNDTMNSVMATGDGFYSPILIGPVGEQIVANAPIHKWVQGNASMLGGVPLTTSVTVIAAQGASIFTYVTGVQVTNMSASSVLVSFGGATSSIVGYTIAPPGGGSNIYFPNALKTNANAAFSASVSGTASIYIAAQGFISKT